MGRRFFNLRSIAALAKKHGIRALMASQAARADFHHEAFALYNETVRAIAQERDITFVDVAAAVIEDDCSCPMQFHNTRKGVERVAGPGSYSRAR